MRSSRPPTWPQFVLWVGAGVSAAAVLGLAFTPFVLVALPVAAGFVLAAVLVGGGNESIVGLLGGVAVLLLLIAWQNRGGPGLVCDRADRRISCEDEWSPWPFALIGGLLLFIAVAVFVRSRRRPGPDR